MNKKILSTLTALSLTCITSTFAWGDESTTISPTDGKLRISFEELTLPDDEKMGFLGGTFLYDINDWLSVGPGAYGALTGERGGFITLGFAAEARKQLTDQLSINAGLFVGAGGGRGGYTLSGGGLMLRPHIGLNYSTQNIGNFGVGISHTKFPDGTISSTQPYVSYEYPFQTLVGNGWLNSDLFKGDGNTKSLDSTAREFAVVYRNYSVADGVLTDSGKPQYKKIGLIGVEWLRYYDDSLFLKIEAEGAMGGESDGFMQIFLGGGYRYPLTNSTSIKLAAQLGVAGGGAVDTGGGFLTEVSVGVQQFITNNTYIGLSGGYINAPDGDFKATNIALQLGYQYGAPKLYGNGKSIKYSELTNTDMQHLRIRLSQQTYLKDDENWRSHHNDLDVQNLGVQADYFLADNVYVTGQGLAAYGGKAGAYMTGQVGAGLHQPLFGSAFFVDVEGLVGAAGGGGLMIDGGLVIQSNVNLGYKISDNFSLIGSVGYIKAIEGPFKAKVIGATLAYRFSIFTI